MTFATQRGTDGAPDSFLGTTGEDILLLQNQQTAAFVSGRQDDDTVTVNSFQQLVGNQTLRGGAGDDTVNVQNNTNFSSSFIAQDEGNDTITLNAVTTSTVQGNVGNDTITTAGLVTSSVVNGNQGNDTLNVNGTTAGGLIYTGIGFDALNINSNSSSGSVFQANDQDDAITIAATVDIQNSTINGNQGNDTITVNNLSGFGGSTIFGGSGNDTVNAANALGDNLIINSNDGNDNVTTATGNDTIVNSSGNDTIVTGAGLNNVTTLAGNSNVTGGANNDTIAVGTGNDTVVGNGGVDNITATAGANNLTGGAAVDNITGGGGADTITGLVGADVLTGGVGADRFITNAVGSSTASVAANTTVTFDSIADFSGGGAAALDVIQLDAVSAVDFNAGVTGTMSALTVNNVANFAALNAALAAANGAALGTSTIAIARVFDVTLTGTGLAAAGVTRLAFVQDNITLYTAADIAIQLQNGAAALNANDFIAIA